MKSLTKKDQLEVDPSLHSISNQSQRSYIQIFSDGACSGNPGPGGWGAIVLYPSDQVLEIGGADGATTNNRMEMMAAVEALQSIEGHSLPVHFYTDSTYIIRGITQWIFGWKKRGWKTAEGADVSNKELWVKISALVQKRGTPGKIEWLYSRGHIGIPGNERCDEIAVAYSKKYGIDLYEGSLQNYFVNILEVPKDTGVPEMRSAKNGSGKSAGDKKGAVTYLSNIGGLVYRHKDWPSCQRRVSGKSGAKFKKANSASEESEILKTWGMSTSLEIKEG
jgi:ribonuclease HI